MSSSRARKEARQLERNRRCGRCGRKTTRRGVTLCERCAVQRKQAVRVTIAAGPGS